MINTSLGIQSIHREIDIINEAEISSVQSYKYTEVIKVGGNNLFLEMATLKGWKGNGTEENPIIIEDYNITSSLERHKEDLIFISDVDLHFKIQNCFLSKGHRAIIASNVENLVVENNTMRDNKQSILVINSNNNTIINNRVELQAGGSYGNIGITWATNIFISGNVICKNGKGISLTGSNNITIEKNELYENRGNAIYISGCSNTVIKGNIIHENRGYQGAIYITDFNGFSINTSIINNTLNENLVAVMAENSYDIEIKKNLIGENWKGIWFDKGNLSKILNNTIYNNEWWAIDLKHTTGVQVSWNNFIGSNNAVFEVTGINEGIIVYKEKDIVVQACDDNLNPNKDLPNNFSFNFWNDHINEEGSSVNGVSEVSYIIDGVSNNTDDKPIIEPKEEIWNEIVSVPRITYPIGSEAIKSTFSISWIESKVYPKDKEVKYSVYYGLDENYDPKNVKDWILLQSDLSTNSCTWDISQIDDEWYNVKVIAQSSTGTTAEDTNDFAFSIGIDRQRDQGRGVYGGSISGLSFSIVIFTIIVLMSFKKKR